MSYFKSVPFGSVDACNAIIECSRGSQNKYEIVPSLEYIEVHRIFQNGLAFPLDYGSIAQTLADDGDMLDVFVFTDFPIAPGIIVTVLPIGMIEMIDDGEVDNKIIAVAKPCKALREMYRSIEDVTAKERKQFEDFYSEVSRQKEKLMTVVAFHGKERASEEISRCHERWISQVKQ